MITPRITRLVRVPDLRAFRNVIAALACDGDPLATRDRLVIVPTRAAALHLTRAIEDRRLSAAGALLLPELVTRDELYERLARRLPERPRMLDEFERLALAGAACRAAAESGAAPPFRLRPGLLIEILAFYDELRRHERDVEAFERIALEALEPGAEIDRGAERLVRQTRFLAAAFRRFEQACAAAGGLDEHALRARLRAVPAAAPWRHVVVTVRDRSLDPHGLWSCDVDLLARLPGLERLDLVVTDTALAGEFHERVHHLLPGIEEVRVAEPGTEAPSLVVPAGSGMAHLARDREEEVAGFARRVRRLARDAGSPPLERMALVVRRPLPYVYVAREVLRSAAVPCQLLDTLPLAAEPYAAAVDLVLACVSANFARSPLVALLASPHFHVGAGDRRLDADAIGALDRALSEASYLGDAAVLETLAAGREGAWAVALTVVRELLPLRAAGTIAGHLATLLEFLRRHEPPLTDGPLSARRHRTRAAIHGALQAMRAAHAAHDASVVEFDTVAAMIRRWIEGQTFAPLAGTTGVHLVDAESAPYGDFDLVQLAGLVEREWPEHPGRGIFYSAAVLNRLGWPAEQARLAGARSAFADLLRLPARQLVLSAFTLEDDTVVSASPFLDEVAAAGLPVTTDAATPAPRTFDWEALALEPVRLERSSALAQRWGSQRLQAAPRTSSRHRGMTAGHAAASFSLSALERYQDCPFKYFASDVLRLEEAPEDEPLLSPRARGRFIHEVFQRFFAAWDASGEGSGRRARPIDPERLDEARRLFEEVAEPLLARLPQAEAALERLRLFGSAVAIGIVDVVLGVEASRPAPVVERWLEYRLDGSFALGSGGRVAPLRGVADRIDLLEGRRLRVIDYKTGYPPNVKRALQVPIYGLCAAERLEARDGEPWTVDEATYVAFTGKRVLVPVVRSGATDRDTVLEAARTRLFDAVDAVERGEFPPRPHDPMICTWCAYPSVCRKDYVGDE